MQFSNTKHFTVKSLRILKKVSMHLKCTFTCKCSKKKKINWAMSIKAKPKMKEKDKRNWKYSKNLAWHSMKTKIKKKWVIVKWRNCLGNNKMMNGYCDSILKRNYITIYVYLLLLSILWKKTLAVAVIPLNWKSQDVREILLVAVILLLSLIASNISIIKQKNLFSWTDWVRDVVKLK